MKKVILSVASLILILTIYSCNNNGNMTDSTDNSNYTAYLAAIDEYIPLDATPYAIMDATFDNEMCFSEPQFPTRGGDDNRGKGNMHRFRMGLWGLGRILFELNLTEEQKVQVETFINDYRNCIKEALVNLREAIKPIIEQANAERRAILERLKTDPDYTRQQAFEDLKALNQRVREQISALRFNDAYCECLRTLLSSIAGILDENQLAKWNEWYSKLTGPCFELID